MDGVYSADPRKVRSKRGCSNEGQTAREREGTRAAGAAAGGRGQGAGGKMVEAQTEKPGGGGWRGERH